MADHKDCKHYDGCGYRNDIGCCPNWCAQFKHKDDVRVVRCKDCKHWKHIEHVGCSDLAKVCMLANYMIGANGYCLYAERKGDGNA